MGLREEKKAQTRKVISDMATLLFIQRGYENVTTKEIAEKANVSAKTLFNYFPNKESLVFDEDEQTEAKLIRAVTHRPKGQSLLESLRQLGLASIDKLKQSDRENLPTFMSLIQDTPELSTYAQKMWSRHEAALGSAIQKESKAKLTTHEAHAIARFVLDSYHRAITASQPKSTLKTLFDLLERGWRG